MNRIIQGDSLHIMKDLPDDSVDMILTDPPYGITRCSWDSEVPLPELWEYIERIAKKDAAIIFTANQPFTSTLVSSRPQWFKHHWIWDKVRPSGFQVAKYKPMMRHEEVLVFCRGRLPYSPIMEKRDKPVEYSYAGSASDSSPLASLRKSGKKTSTHKYPQSIKRISKDEPGKKLHPTQKPIALFEYLIRTYSSEGDTILDPFIGSGTTAIAAIRTNRKFIGIEQDPEYVAIARERIANAQPRLLAS